MQMSVDVVRYNFRYCFVFKLLNTISTSELRQFLSQPDVIGNGSDICAIFNNYNNTPLFLETVCSSCEGCHVTNTLLAMRHGCIQVAILSPYTVNTINM